MYELAIGAEKVTIIYQIVLNGEGGGYATDHPDGHWSARLAY